jgi:predicted DNA-binding transcriptional regulator AlpA
MATENVGGVVYLSAAQLAARYGVHIVTVWRWAQAGRLPQPVRLAPGTTRWRKEEIEACDAKRTSDSD